MNILYLSTVCAQKRFDRLVREGKITKMPQAQKYHHLLLEGLRKHTDKLEVISSYPVNLPRGSRAQKEMEMEDGISYTYPGYLNFPVLRQLMIWFGVEVSEIQLLYVMC